MKVLNYLKRKLILYIVNRLLVGTRKCWFPVKRRLLNKLDEYHIGTNTSIVGPIFCTGSFSCGADCWIGANLNVWGNGKVVLGNNIDVAPDVTFFTGTHKVGNCLRRAGEGYNTKITIGDGCWLGGRSTFLNEIVVGGRVCVAACACVAKDMPADVLVGGVPAKIIKQLKDHEDVDK